MIDYHSQRSMVDASLLVDMGSHDVPDRRRKVRREDDVKRAPMRPAGVRKMRQSRKRRRKSGE